jgi:hypothetical protein
MMPKDLRAAYATIAWEWFAPPHIAQSAYFARILGHSELDLVTVQSYIDFYPLGHKRDFQRAYRAGLRDAINQLAQLAQAETDERKRLQLEERRAQFQTALHNNPRHLNTTRSGTHSPGIALTDITCTAPPLHACLANFQAYVVDLQSVPRRVPQRRRHPAAPSQHSTGLRRAVSSFAKRGRGAWDAAVATKATSEASYPRLVVPSALGKPSPPSVITSGSENTSSSSRIMTFQGSRSVSSPSV